MIELTPLDVRKKREDFKRAVRGYDSIQVDAFLEVVSERLEQLVREHGSMSDRVTILEKQLETYQERERALNEALLAAQELREEARSQAERDAAVRLREAETHAEAILLDADQAIRHSQRRLDDLRARRRQFLKSLRSVMERFEDYLELEETRLETEPEDHGDLLERLQSDLGPGETAQAASIAATPAGDDEPDEGLGGGEGTTGRHASDVLPATARNGQSEDLRVSAEAEEEPGSPVATPSPITPAESGD